MTASVNERLRTALLRTGTTTQDLALCCGVDPKTAERWISTGRVPHRRHRWAAARRLGCEDEYLWPDAPGEESARRAEAVARRGEEEGIGAVAIGAKIRNVLALFRPLLEAGAEIRLHATALYNSMYRTDDDLLVNTHILGYVAACAPVLHLRRISGGAMVATYLDSFERI